MEGSPDDKIKGLCLFDEIERTHDGIKDPHESHFSFLNRSAWDDVEQARRLCEEWFKYYKQDASDGEIAEFRRRFRDKHNILHYSTWFELLVHQILVRLGASSIKIHPELSGTSKHPDFMADMDDSCIIIEATVVAPDDNSSTFYVRDVIEKIYQLKSEQFGLLIEEVQGTLERQIPKKHLLAKLQKFLNKHDPDEVMKLIDRGGRCAAPRKTIRHDEWQIKVSIHPISPNLRGPKKNIVSGPVFVKWGDDVPEVRKKIKSKVRKYGKIQNPFIIALNVYNHIGFDHTDARDVLFGREGIWGTSEDPQYRDLSGVVFFTDTNSHCVQRAPARLYINPFASPNIISRIPESLYRFPHVKDGNYLIQGESVSSLLGL